MKNWNIWREGIDSVKLMMGETSSGEFALAKSVVSTKLREKKYKSSQATKLKQKIDKSDNPDQNQDQIRQSIIQIINNTIQKQPTQQHH